MKTLDYFLKEYLRNRPIFLAVLRAKESFLYQEYLPLKKPVLDFGCGDGYFAKVTFAKNFQFPISLPRRQVGNFQFKRQIIDIGLDVKESRIDEVEKQGIYKKIVKYDGKEIPFKDNYFETVVSNSVLEHVDGVSFELQEINRVLKKTGKFLTTVMAAPWEDYLFGVRIFGQSYKDYMRKKQVHINLLTRRQWDNQFKKAGFKINKTIGHIDKSASQLIDILHYFSIPNLISYKLFAKWVLFPKMTERFYPQKYFLEKIKNNVEADQSAALFYELEKK